MSEPTNDPVEARLPLRPMGSALTAAASKMRDIPLLGPGIAAAQDELARVERLVWQVARQRLENGNGRQPTPAGQRLAQLLTDSVEQSAEQARDHLLLRLLDDMEPDEARILAAMSDGTTYPVVHVITKSAFGTSGARLLENVSTVGRSAGIALPDYVPIYIARLRRLGLVTVGPESNEHADGYELLTTEKLVRDTQTAHDAPTRLIRRTLSLSPLGVDLWNVGNVD